MAPRPAARSKYRAVPVDSWGRNRELCGLLNIPFVKKFDSGREYERWCFLQLQQQQGDIRNLECQVRYPLIVDGKKIGTYIADFTYEEETEDGSWVKVVEDVKGFLTPLYRRSKKHLEAQYGIRIRET